MAVPSDVEEEIGGVQGSKPPVDDAPAKGKSNFGGTDIEAPDAGEIEWAGAVVKKAPGSGTT